jgi:hypothetical protein
MMRIAAMRSAAAMLVAAVSFAALGQAAVAVSTQGAAQIRVMAYSSLLRTEIIGVIGQPTTITFPPGESVYRVVQTGKPDKNGSLADAGWQGAAPSEIKDTPLGNNLTLWPVMPGESTMTVITMSSAGAQKVYPFRLVARPDSDGAADMPGVVLNLIFKGGTAPGMPAAARKPQLVRAAAIRRRTNEIAQAAAKEQLRTDAFNAHFFQASGRDDRDLADDTNRLFRQLQTAPGPTMRIGEATLRHLLAPIQDVLDDPATTEIVVQRPGEVGIERGGKWSWREVAAFDYARLDAIGLLAGSLLAKRFDPAHAICMTTLPDGQRCTLCRPPVTAPGTISVTIRIPSKRCTPCATPTLAS